MSSILVEEDCLGEQTMKSLVDIYLGHVAREESCSLTLSSQLQTRKIVREMKLISEIPNYPVFSVGTTHTNNLSAKSIRARTLKLYKEIMRRCDCHDYKRQVEKIRCVTKRVVYGEEVVPGILKLCQSSTSSSTSYDKVQYLFRKLVRLKNELEKIISKDIEPPPKRRKLSGTEHKPCCHVMSEDVQSWILQYDPRYQHKHGISICSYGWNPHVGDAIGGGYTVVCKNDKCLGVGLLKQSRRYDTWANVLRIAIALGQTILNYVPWWILIMCLTPAAPLLGKRLLYSAISSPVKQDERVSTADRKQFSSRFIRVILAGLSFAAPHPYKRRF